MLECALQVTVAKQPFHTAELEIGLTVAKSTQPTHHQPSMQTVLHSAHIILHTRSIKTHTHIPALLLSFSPFPHSLCFFIPFIATFSGPPPVLLPPPFSKYLSFLCSFSFIKMDFLKPPFVLLTAPLSIGPEKGMQFQSFKWLSGQPGWGLGWTRARFKWEVCPESRAWHISGHRWRTLRLTRWHLSEFTWEWLTECVIRITPMWRDNELIPD